MPRCGDAMKANPHKGHRKRVRTRYREHGLDSFHEHEVLELLLYYCYPMRDTNEIAHKMLNTFGSLHNLFETDVEVLVDTLDCTENVAILLNLIPALANRYYRSRWGEKIVLDKADVAGEYAMSLFVGLTLEHFYVLNLDAQRKLINASLISKGVLDESAVYPRKIAHDALNSNASCVILTHNHPGGTIRPSAEDDETTRRISEVLMPLGVKTVDHIIVAGDKYYSYASRDRSRFVIGY